MAIVLSSYASVFAESLYKLANDEIALLMGVGGEIGRLQSRLERILPVLADADTRRLQDDAIKHWVQQLKDAIYAAEDIIEKYVTEAEKLKRKRSQWTSSSSVSCCLSPLSCFSHYAIRGHQTGNKIKSLNQKLDDILKDMSFLNLRSASVVLTRDSGISRKTSSLVEPDLVGEGIEDDTKMLVDMLVSKENNRRQGMSVFAIVGMGGIGKTTLAQKIFNDDKLRSQFSHMSPVWVCVSQDFEEADLLRSIIKRAGGIPGEAKDRADLEPLLYETVKGKELFLVLDDVWNAEVWGKLLYKPLQSVSAGSVVLVTTRHEAVATRMRSTYNHYVKKLPDEDGWSLLCNMVFGDDKDAENMKSSLEDVGMKIVKKCDGLPLAIKAIAGVLCCKGRRQADWEEVLQNPAWTLTRLPEDVIGALYLSYSELPSHLKQCFLHLALFPEDAVLQRTEITRLWIAEGFVEAKENTLMEEVGKEYWKELVHRSLLQPHAGWYDAIRCKMHDLLRSLAVYLASDECFSQDLIEVKGKSVPRTSLSMKPRRVSIRNGEAIPEVIKKQVSLRTLLLPFHRNLTKDTTKLKYLRVLSIRNSSIDKLPDSIGGLKLLRYLDFSKSAIREIPESIGDLENLQFLIMSCCKNLHNLPKSITNLLKLRCLDLSDTDVQSAPPRIRKLNNLVMLWGFWVSCSSIDHNKRRENRVTNQGDQRNGESNYCNIGDLGSLSCLNSLTLSQLENVSSRTEARVADLGGKTHLVYLELHCTTCSSTAGQQADYGQERIEKIGNIFEELYPPRCLEILKIEGYFGLEHPSWLMKEPSSFLPNLRRLELKNCVAYELLPPLGLLPQLDCLWIEGAPAIKSIGPELFGVSYRDGKPYCPRSSFPKLEILHLENMPNFEEWNWLSEEDDRATALLPSLRNLAIEGCPKLKSLPCSLLNHATALTCLWIKGAESLKEVQNILNIQVLVLIDNPYVERVSDLPSLKKLLIEDCKALTEVEGLSGLQLLELRDSSIESLPEWLSPVGAHQLQFAALRRFVIEGNAQLLSRCLVSNPDWHKIQQIPCVDAYCNDEPTYYIHYTLSPFSFDTNLSNEDVSQQQQRQ